MDRPSLSPSASSPAPAFGTVAVVGLGTMGTGIAEVLARAGREVVGIDVSEAQAALAVTALENSTARAVAKGRLTEGERTDALARFRVFTDLQAAASTPTWSSRSSRSRTRSSSSSSATWTRWSDRTRSWPPAPTPCR